MCSLFISGFLVEVKELNHERVIPHHEIMPDPPPQYLIGQSVIKVTGNVDVVAFIYELLEHFAARSNIHAL